MRRLIALIATALLLTVTGTSSAAHKPASASVRVSIAKRLSQGLKGYPIREQAWKLEEAAHRHNVNPFMMAAISGVESTFGRASCRSNPKNIWGLGACDRAWKVPYFETWNEAFGYYARFLKRTWPSARTVHELYGYCSGCSSWSGEVAHLMRNLFGSGSTVIYPA